MIKWTCNSCKHKNYLTSSRCRNCGKLISAALTEVDTNGTVQGSKEETKETPQK
jgi:hypothetical protein